MKNSFKSLLVVSLLLFSISSNSQHTYYVSGSGSDSNNGLSTTTPFKTLQHLKYFLNNGGDRAYIFAGVYEGYVTFDYDNGTATSAINPIIVEPYGNGPVIIEGSSRSPSATIDYVPHLVNIQTDYFIFRNIELRNSGNASVAINANHVTIDNVYAHNGYSIGVGGYGLNATVSNCILHDFYDFYLQGENADGISFATTSPATSTTSGTGYHHIFNNVVYNCSDDGIDTWNTSGSLIEGNIVHHTGYSYDSSNDTYSAAGEGNGIKAGGGGYTGNNIVRKNVSYYNRNSGFDGNSGIYNQFYNNTAYKNPYGFFILSVTDTIKNNLAILNTVSAYTGTLSSNTSLVYKNSWNLGITDPYFRDTSADPANFRLMSPGPAIDAGIDVGLPYFGAKPDLGAYEYKLASDENKGIEHKEDNLVLKNISINPNPMTSISILDISTDIKINNVFIEIYDSLGNKIKRMKIYNYKSVISNEGLKKGICFYIVLNNEEKIGEGKLIIE